MKITTTLFAFLFILSSTFAQEMKLKYSLELKSSNPEMETAIQMTEGSTVTVYAMEGRSRIEMKMGQLMRTITILDREEEQGVMLMDGMTGKQAATIEASDFDNFNNHDEEELEIEYIGDTKTILGYKCKNAIVYLDDQDAEMTFWYTEELKTSDSYLGEYSKYGLPGVALEYNIIQSGMSMEFTATEVETSIDDEEELFDISIPNGYTVRSFKEIRSMSGQ